MADCGAYKLRTTIKKNSKNEKIGNEIWQPGTFQGSGVQGQLWLYSDLEATQDPV